MKEEKIRGKGENEDALELVRKFISGDYSARGVVEAKGSSELIKQLNFLGERLRKCIPALNNFDERINSLIQVLLRYTRMDFSTKAEITEAGDELDAIALGLNTLAEELVSARENELNKIEAMRQLNSFLHNILENIPNAVIIKDTQNFRYLRVNKAAEEVYGLPREEMVGKTDADFFLPEEVKLLQKKDTETIAERRLTEISELKLTTPSGKKLLNIKKLPVEDEDSQPIFLVSLAEDITARHKMLYDLRESEERFRLLVNQVKDYAIFMIDPEGYITSWNEGAKFIKGYTAEEAIGKHISIFYNEAEIKRGEPWYNLKQAELRGRFDATGVRKRKDGTEFWADVVITALYDSEKKLRGFAKVTRDVTSKKRAEETELALKGKLEQKIDELAAANSELEAFSYSVSHDLRAPLRAINGYMQILLRTAEKKLSEDEVNLMKQVVANASRMGQLIEDLLNFARVGREKADYRMVNMAELANAVITEMRKSADLKRVTFEIQDIPPASGDGNLLTQVFYNLLGNAVKYSAVSQNPVVEVGATEKNNNVVYYVKDNGIGFDMKFYNKLFGVFQRLHDSRQFEGTGVGLAIVKRIIEKHGGRIWAESTPGKGATFYFVLNEKK